MKRLLLPFIAVLALAFRRRASRQRPSRCRSAASGFKPKSVTINQGDTVRWINTDKVNHQIVANKGAFASGILQARRDVHVHVQHVRRLRVPRRAPSVDDGSRLRQGTAAAGVRRRQPADRHLRRADDDLRHRLEPEGQRAGARFSRSRTARRRSRSRRSRRAPAAPSTTRPRRRCSRPTPCAGRR